MGELEAKLLESRIRTAASDETGKVDHGNTRVGTYRRYLWPKLHSDGLPEIVKHADGVTSILTNLVLQIDWNILYLTTQETMTQLSLRSLMSFDLTRMKGKS